MSTTVIPIATMQKPVEDPAVVEKQKTEEAITDLINWLRTLNESCSTRLELARQLREVGVEKVRASMGCKK